MRTLDLRPLAEHTAEMRQNVPYGEIVLWASLECTNFSRAKGGQPRDADSRTLAEHLLVHRSPYPRLYPNRERRRIYELGRLGRKRETD